MLKQGIHSRARIVVTLAVLLGACGANDQKADDRPESCACEFQGEGQTPMTLRCGEQTCWGGSTLECNASQQVVTVVGACEAPEPPADGKWHALSLETSAHLRAIASSGNEQDPRFLVVGDQGRCFQFDKLSGATAEPCDIPGVDGLDLTSAALAGKRSVVSARGGAMFLRDPDVNAGAWAKVQSSHPDELFVLTASGPNIFVAGSHGFVGDIVAGPTPQLKHYEGVATTHPFVGEGPVSWRSASIRPVAGHYEGWLLSDVGALGHLVSSSTGTTLTFERRYTNDFAVNAVLVLQDEAGAVSEVVVVGDEGNILSLGPQGVWSTQYAASGENLYGVFEGRNGLYAVGSKGTILYRERGGTAWTLQESGVTHTLRAGTRRDLVGRGQDLIVGDNGTLLVRVAYSR